MYTVEPHYNEDLGTMKITLLYQVSHYISLRVKKQRNIKRWDQKITLLWEGFVISDLFITKFHCHHSYILKTLTLWRLDLKNKKFNFDICVVWWCSDRSINRQEYKDFKNFCIHYQDIYDWISSLHNLAVRCFILTQQSIGERSTLVNLSLCTCMYL